MFYYQIHIFKTSKGSVARSVGRHTISHNVEFRLQFNKLF